ncbi:serine protease [bacterium]|nr:serine protease [bacterium]
MTMTATAAAADSRGVAWRAAFAALIAAAGLLALARPVFADMTPARAIELPPADDLRRAAFDAPRFDDRSTKKPRIVGYPAGLAPLARADWLASHIDGEPAWRIALHAGGAAFLRAHFAALPTSPTWSVTFVGEDGVEQMVGAGDVRGAEFWGPLVPGDTMIVELRGVDDPSLFDIDRASVGTERFWMPGPEKEGSCYVNLACENAWLDTGSGVAMILFEESDFSALCSGSLLNDKFGSERPFFLSAYHCVNNEAEADTTIVFWDFQTSSCTGTPPSPNSVPRTFGSRFLAGNFDLDYSLLILDDDPPDDASFLGWTTSDLKDGEDVVTIHHPGGTHKRISFAEIIGDTFEYWGVRYVEGSTEGGSSGAPLFNEDRQIVGYLSGGTASCTAMGEPDFFGKFGRAYENGIGSFLTSASLPTTTTSTTFDGGPGGASDDDGLGPTGGNDGGGICCGC